MYGILGTICKLYFIFIQILFLEYNYITFTWSYDMITWKSLLTASRAISVEVILEQDQMEKGKKTAENGHRILWIRAKTSFQKCSFLASRQASISMTSDYTSGWNQDLDVAEEFEGFEFELVEADRLEIIEHHFGVRKKRQNFI